MNLPDNFVCQNPLSKIMVVAGFCGLMPTKTFDNMPLPQYILKSVLSWGNFVRIPVYDNYTISNPP